MSTRTHQTRWQGIPSSKDHPFDSHLQHEMPHSNPGELTLHKKAHKKAHKNAHKKLH